MNRVLIFDIYRGTSHDGPGLRTTFFFKGCTLGCRWCHNPEGISPERLIWWEERKCIGCLSCKDACKNGAIIADDTGIYTDQDMCRLCGNCVKACPSTALSFAGKYWDVDELVKEALKAKSYFKSFNGGVTVSGGEPLFQYPQVSEFLKQLKDEGIHTAVDTCGNVPFKAFESVFPYADIFLYDIKILNSKVHREFTGSGNEQILSNLLKLTETIKENPGKEIWIRTPLIPEATATEENLKGISRFILENLSEVCTRWELCAFNNVCNSRYIKLRKEWYYADAPLMNQDTIDRLRMVVINTGFPEDKLVISGLVAK